MNKLTSALSWIAAITAILIIPSATAHFANASTCSAQLQANEKSGSHTVGPIIATSVSGSCSTSGSARAGQGSPHISGSDAFNDPGFRTGTCTSNSAGPGGLSSNFDDGQASSTRSCSTHSP